MVTAPLVRLEEASRDGGSPLLCLETHPIVNLYLEVALNNQWKRLECPMSDHVIDLPVAGQRVEEAVPVLSMNGKLLLSLPILIVGFSVDYNEQIFSFLVAESPDCWILSLART